MLLRHTACGRRQNAGVVLIRWRDVLPIFLRVDCSGGDLYGLSRLDRRHAVTRQTRFAIRPEHVLAEVEYSDPALDD